MSDNNGHEMIPVDEKPIKERGRCRALTRNGEVCNQPITTGMGDDFPYCFNHTKLMTSDKSRQYLKTLPPELKDRFEENLDKVDPKDLRPEIAKIRTIAGSLDEALNRKIEAAAAEGKQIGDGALEQYTSLTVALSEAVRRMAESQARMSPDNVVPLHEVQNMIRRMITIIRKHTKDPEIREKISDEIAKACLLEISEQSIALVPGGAVPKNE